MTLETKTLHSIGRVTVRIEHILDEHNESDYLGEFSNYREPSSVNQKLVHRDSGAVLDHHGIWRDESGRISPTPEDHHDWREYGYTWHDNGHEHLKHAIQDSRRLEDLNNGGWCYLGIVATVVYDGAEIGSSSLWGVESDSEDSYLESTAREVAAEALGEARQWIDRNTVAA